MKVLVFLLALAYFKAISSARKIRQHNLSEIMNRQQHTQQEVK